MKWTSGLAAALLAVVASGSLYLAPTQCQAETLYDLSLSGGGVTGTGTYATNETISGTETISPVSLDITMSDGTKFNLSDAVGGVSIFFSGGVFQYMTADLTNNGATLDLSPAGYSYNGAPIAGSVTDFIGTPLPTALLLFAGGLGALALTGRRRKREHRIAAMAAE